MAVVDFEDRVLMEIGSFPTAPSPITDADFKNQVFEDATREVVGELPSSVWEQLAVPYTDTGSGVGIDDFIVLEAWKGNYQARRINYFDAQNTLNEFLATDPVWYIFQDAAYVKPSGGTIFLCPDIFSVDKDTSDLGFSELLNRLIVLKAAIHFYKYKLRETREGIDAEITLPTVPTAPSAPSFSYSDATATSISTPTISAFGTAPVYTSPTLTEDYTDFNSYFDLEDSEVGELALQYIRNEQDRLKTDIQDALNVFNDANVEYQATIQKNIREAEFALRANEANAKLATDVSVQNEIQTINAAISQYQQSLAKYGAEVQAYSAEVRAIVQAWEISLRKADTEIRQIHFDRDRIQKDYEKVFMSYTKNYAGMSNVKVKFHEF